MFPISFLTATKTELSSKPRRVRYSKPSRRSKEPRGAVGSPATAGAAKRSSEAASHSARPMIIAGFRFSAMSKCSRIAMLRGLLPQFPNSHPMLPTTSASSNAAATASHLAACFVAFFGAVSLFGLL